METYLNPLNQGRFKRRIAYVGSDDDCWIWSSTCMKKQKPDGSFYKFPTLQVRDAMKNERTVMARRFAWEIETGRPLSKDDQVRNVCGEELCVKPHEKHNIPVPIGSGWSLAEHRKKLAERRKTE